MFGFLRMGTTGLAAQEFGAGAIEEVATIFMRAVVIALVLGGLIVTLQWPLHLLLFGLFSSSQEVQDLAAAYYHIRIWGAPALLVHLVQLGILFALQRMRDTLILSVGLNMTNLVLDILFVLGFGWGVEGVALATLVSEWGAMFIGLVLVVRALKTNHWQGFQSWRQKQPKLWNMLAAKRLFHVSSNLVLRTFFVQLPFFVGTLVASNLRAIESANHDLVLAVHGVLMQLFFVMTYALDGFAHTAETLTGFAYGAKSPKQLRQATLYSCVWCLLLALFIAGNFWLAGDFYVSWLTTSPEIQNTATSYMPWLVIAPFFCLLAFVFDGIFIGTTHIVEMRNSMILAVIVWAACLWLSFDSLGYHAVWLSTIVFMLVRSALLGYYYPKIEQGAYG